MTSQSGHWSFSNWDLSGHWALGILQYPYMPDDIQIISLDDPLYPAPLKNMPEPPAELYVRGDPRVLSHDKMLAVVGSRHANHEGKKYCEFLLKPAVRSGLILVSGLAYGIDSLAHRLCIDFNQPTIAVLGSGVDDRSIYPHLHLKLAHQIIASGGAIISEHPPGTAPLAYHFPARNRIIAGLAGTTLVIQAAKKSGTLITARLALEAGRDVWAVPGNIFNPLAAGTNHLIQQGALPIIDPQDIIDLFNLSTKTDLAAPADLTPTQAKLFQLLSSTPQHVDQISASSGQPVSAISITLTELELLDIIEHIGGQRYVKK